MERKSPNVPEPDDSQPRAPDKPDDGSRSIWSRIYSVITHPFRVIGNLLCLSRRGTSEDHSPSHIQETIEYREAASTSEPLEFELEMKQTSKAASTSEQLEFELEAASNSEPLEVEIEKKWTSVPLEDDNTVIVRPDSSDDEDEDSIIITRERKKYDDLVLHTRKLSNQPLEVEIEKKWTSVPLEDDNMRWLGAVIVRPDSSEDEYGPSRFSRPPRFYETYGVSETYGVCETEGVSEDDSTSNIQDRTKYQHLVLHTKGRDLKLRDIGKIETEKPVAAWHPVPPAPPPPNLPI